MCASYLSGMYVWMHVRVAGVCGYLVLQSMGACDRCIYVTVRTQGVSCLCMDVVWCLVDGKVFGVLVCECRQCA